MASLVVINGWTAAPAAATTPAGWTLLDSGVGVSVACPDATHCWEVAPGNDGAGNGSAPPLINVSHDDGRTWASEQPPPGDYVLSAVACSDDSHCWAVGYGPSSGGSTSAVVIATSDGGISWTTQDPPVSSGSQLLAVSCPSATFCASAGAANSQGGAYVIVTTNAGATWTEEPFPAETYSPTGVSCPDSGHCWAEGGSDVDGSYVAGSTDGGQTWTVQEQVSSVGLTAISCPSVSRCLAVGGSTGGGSGVLTTDAGATWSRPAFMGLTPAAVSCSDAQHCMVVGGGAASSSTFGADWSLDRIPEDFYADSVSCPTAATCLGVTEDTSTNPYCGCDFTLSGTTSVTDAAGIDAGYWLAARDGGVFSYGPDGAFFGSAGHLHLDAPIVGIAPTPDGGGYWLVAADGGVFSYGDAAFYGSMAGKPIDGTVVGITPYRFGSGYWLVTNRGAVYAFGAAAFEGDASSQRLTSPVVGMAEAFAPGYEAYWLATASGQVLTFGPGNVSYGSATDVHLSHPIVGIESTPDLSGYWLVASDGGVFTYGDAAFEGSTGSIRLAEPIVGMAAPDSGGYWLVAADGGVFSFGDAPFYGSAGGTRLNQPVVGME